MNTSSPFGRSITLRRILPALALAAFPVLRAETVTINGAPGAGGVTHVDPGSTNITKGSAGGGGGEGGAAVAASQMLGEALNHAVAIGGNGGNGGSGGEADIDGQGHVITPPGFGGGGGHGGNATATATADRTGTGGGNVEARAEAKGGIGGAGGSGGQPPNMNGPGAWGGNSNATATARTTNGSVTSNASAGFQDVWAGNVATASATGSNTSSDPVYVNANAYGGRGPLKTGNRPVGDQRPDGEPGMLGSVDGTSTGGGQVQVIGSAYGGYGGEGVGEGGYGADVSVTDAVTGSTTGLLSLSQSANGGYGGQGRDQGPGWANSFPVLIGTGGRGGNASSILNRNDTSAASLTVQVSAGGGTGGTGYSGLGGTAGTATAGANITGIGNLDVYVSPSGGNGNGNAFGGGFSDGAPGILLPCSAVSTGTGKMVSLNAYQGGGQGGGPSYNAISNGGNGADSSLTNMVSGSAPGGQLTLTQSVRAGRGGNVYSLYGSGSNANTFGGRGGDAFSSLDFNHSGEAKLTVNVNAYAGESGTDWQNRQNSPGGDATAIGGGTDSGDVDLTVRAIAGNGTAAGDASATGSAISTGAGNVTVNVSATAGNTNVNGTSAGTATTTAYGQSGSGNVSVAGTATTGGGVPTNSSGQVNGRSITLSNAVSGRTAGKLTLSQTAKAGDGTVDSSGSVGNGGSASSSLILPNGNPDGGALTANADAFGGNSSTNSYNQTPGTPGPATAVCDLMNAGDVSASASARAGTATGYDRITGYPVVMAMSAKSATASAVCTRANGVASAGATVENADTATSSPLTATAQTLGGAATLVRATASKSLASPSDTVSTRAIVGADDSYVPSLKAIGMASFNDPYEPGLGPNGSAALAGMTPLLKVAASSYFTTGTATLTFNTTGFTGPVRMALLSGQVYNTSAPLGTFRFTVSRGAVTVVDQTFTNWVDASTFFTDQVFDLGSVSSFNGEELNISFTYTGTNSTNASFYPWLVVAAQPKSSNANLSNLVLSSGSLSPNFVSGTTSYTAYVPNGVSAITVSPMVADAGATVTVNGTTVPSGSASSPIPLLVGSTTSINITVTASDGTQKTYTVDAMRAPSIGSVLNAPQLVWTTGGTNSEGWIAQATTTHDGVSAAQIDHYMDNQTSWLETTVTGAGTLTFWWKVNSESGYDYLAFTVDGQPQAVAPRISGYVDWQQMTVAVTEGNHVLRWTFTSDSSVTATGAWVDEVVWTPATTAQQGWRQLYFGTTGNTGNASDNADPDGDGVPNLLEWACGLNPTTSGPLNPTTDLTGGTLKYVYPRAVAAVNGGAAFTVEWSDTLAPDSWSSAGVTDQVLSNNGTTQQVQATLPAGSGGQRFIRLRVTAPP